MGHHSIIEYCVERGMTPGQTIKEMKSSQIYHNVCRVFVYISGISFFRLDGVTAGPKYRQSDLDKQCRNSGRFRIGKDRPTIGCSGIYSLVGTSKYAVQRISDS